MTEQSKKCDRLYELKEHATELRDFEDPGWDGPAEDREFLWNLKETLSRSVKDDEVDETPDRIIDSENDELALIEAELLLARFETTSKGEDNEKEEVENAERSV